MQIYIPIHISLIGWAVFDVNYRGSSGRGRAFRDMLLGNWGIADRNDMVNGAEYLIKNGLVNPKMVCIMGSSAGGFLVLSTLFHPNNPFSAAVSHYGFYNFISPYTKTIFICLLGVADLEDLFKVSFQFYPKILTENNENENKALFY